MYIYISPSDHTFPSQVSLRYNFVAFDCWVGSFPCKGLEVLRIYLLETSPFLTNATPLISGYGILDVCTSVTFLSTLVLVLSVLPSTVSFSCRT